MDGKGIFKILFRYEALLTVLLWIIYDPCRRYFGAYSWVGLVLFLMPGVPAIRFLLLSRIPASI